MEQLLANLLDSCDPSEEAMLLRLHTRLVNIQAEQGDLGISRNRLKALQSRRGQ